MAGPIHSNAKHRDLKVRCGADVARRFYIANTSTKQNTFTQLPNVNQTGQQKEESDAQINTHKHIVLQHDRFSVLDLQQDLFSVL